MSPLGHLQAIAHLRGSGHCKLPKSECDVAYNMDAADQLRNQLRSSLQGYRDRTTQAKRAYFDLPSHALEGKQEVEFSIKKAVSDRYKVPFRSVVFTGSAQLGFSPTKDTLFVKGSSDLDVACIDTGLFQTVWLEILDATDNFSDQSLYTSRNHGELLTSQILRRGMILMDYLPRCSRRTIDASFWSSINSRYKEYFGRVSLAIYINEEAFCRKQSAALDAVLG